jgi:Ca-activated chloride channel family protein
MKRTPFPATSTIFMWCLAACSVLGTQAIPAQTPEAWHVLSANTIIPQWHRSIHPLPPGIPPRPRPPLPDSSVRLAGIDADIRIDDRRATTTLTLTLRNQSGRLQDAEVLVPIPAGATLGTFEIEGVGGKLPARLMPKEEARRIYDEIVRRLIDPGLLEFAGTGLIRSSVFPVPPNGIARAKITYEEILAEADGRIEYALPRSESADASVPWKIDLQWKPASGSLALYCPSHPAELHTDADGTLRMAVHGTVQPGAFRVAALRRGTAGSAALSVVAYPPKAGEDGYFLMIVAPPEASQAPALKREVTLVLDHSGSMAGEKIEQIRAAALQVTEGLDEGEFFNIIFYNEGVEALFQGPRAKDPTTTQIARAALAGMRPSGGTNIHDALQRAITQPVTAGQLPVVLFLTDGLATVGETFEKKIRDGIAHANTGKRRIFSFGVGLDVNTPLLARLSDDSRATSVFVLPKEDVEMKVVSLFRRLAGPVVAEPVFEVNQPGGGMAAGRTADVLPNTLPDLFAGDARVVLGRYRGDQPLALVVRGRSASGEVQTKLAFDPATATVANAHIPRLWATRRIGVLTDALRDLGSATGSGNQLPAPNDPRARELVDEIIKLSLQHGVLSEYTAFLARDGAPFDPRPAEIHHQALRNFQDRAMRTRSGAGSFNQEANSVAAKASSVMNRDNRYLDQELQPARAGGVQQVGDKTFFENKGAWTDSSLAGNAAPPDLVEVRIGTPDFDKLVDSLVAGHRQSVLSLPGDIIFNHEGRNYKLVH